MMELFAVLASVVVLIAFGALALSWWCVWLLHRHWPKPDWVAAKEQMRSILVAYTNGRDSVPIREALIAMQRELDVAKEREVMTRQAEMFVADQVTPDRADLERPSPISTFGPNIPT